MSTWTKLCAGTIGVLLAAAPGSAANPSVPVGGPVLEAPTLHCLGAYWIVRGDANRNARVDLAYRKVGEESWHATLPLLRVEKGHTVQKTHAPELVVPDDCWLFAGSAVLLKEDTRYELKLTLRDPDGGAAEKVLKARTASEPRLGRPTRTLHVTPRPAGGMAKGAGSGTAADPFVGLAAAANAARPGDLFLLRKGTYRESLDVRTSGRPGRPIVYRAAGDGEVVLEGKGKGWGVRAWGVHDVWFEGLTIRNFHVGVAAGESQRTVVRRCRITGCNYGVKFNTNKTGKVSGFFVTDNVIEGPCRWPRTKGIENPRGMEATGRGHVIAYNRISRFADAIDTFGSGVCAAIDIHNNDVSECTDDGIEMDFSERNTRCFRNRLTNVFQGISIQPVFGGPVYVFRNTLYNVGLETFKMHHNGGPKHRMDWAPTGAMFFHNTSVKKGVPLLLWTPLPVYNCTYRNNLFVGTRGPLAYDGTAPMINCDFDYDGFAGGPYKKFLRWNGKKYDRAAQVRKSAPVYRHVVDLGPGSPFARGTRPPQDVATIFEGVA